MADKSLDKIKEQCLELILNVMPVTQLVYVFIMAVVIDRLNTGRGNSVINSLTNVGLEKLFGIKEGMFWSVGVLVIGVAFFLAMINTWILKRSLRHSFSSSKVSEKLSEWMTLAIKAMSTLSTEEKTPIQSSVSAELEKRLKSYHGKRMLCESMFSILSSILFGSIYVVAMNISSAGTIRLSGIDVSVALFSFLFWWMLHRSSVQYAISKVIPLQVYLSAAAGEIAFFIEID